jgi:hypothetical protein
MEGVNWIEILCFKFKEKDKCKKEVNQAAVVKAVPGVAVAAVVAVVDVVRIKNEVLADIAFARSVVKRRCINRFNYARINNVRNLETA